MHGFSDSEMESRWKMDFKWTQSLLSSHFDFMATHFDLNSPNLSLVTLSSSSETFTAQIMIGARDGAQF